MRKLGTIRDFKNTPLPGTLNMLEKTNFLCGKGMDIQDEIRVRSINMWKNDALSADFNYDQFEGLKKDSIMSTLIAKDQTQAEKDTLTKWVFEINLKKILREYLYSQIFTDNVFSDFHNISPENVINNNQSLACYDYIDKNILSRYKLKEFVLWTHYYELKQSKVDYALSDSSIVSYPLLKQTPIYSFFAKPKNDPDKSKSIVSTKEYTEGILDVTYKQEKSSQYFTFLYYYDIIFYKI